MMIEVGVLGFSRRDAVRGLADERLTGIRLFLCA